MYLPRAPKELGSIMIVSDYPTAQEYEENFPGFGGVGKLLAQGGIDYKTCYMTAVWWKTPLGGKLTNWCKKKADVGGNNYPYPAIAQGKWMPEEHLEVEEELWREFISVGDVPANIFERLAFEIRLVKPKLILALGVGATWALLGNAKITKVRGTIAQLALPVEDCPDVKVLATFHPRMIFAQRYNMPLFENDLDKAKYEGDFGSIERVEREIWIEPDLVDIERFYNMYIRDNPDVPLAIDIETGNKTIKCFGVSVGKEVALVIPFQSYASPDYSYWETARSELTAWEWVNKILTSPNQKQMQNGLYDTYYLWFMGLGLVNWTADSMLLAHSINPELPKSLDVLASLYCNEVAWKTHRPKHMTNKAEDSI